MKRTSGLFFALILSVAGHRAMSQDSVARYQLAIFSPLFLDSAFDESSTYRYGKSFPKFLNPGLEFYEGAELAIDSLISEGVPLDVHIYDSRSIAEGIDATVKSPEFDSIDLVIGHVNAKEARLLANAVSKKKHSFH